MVDTPGPENTEDWAFLAAVYDEETQEVTVYVDTDAGTVGDQLAIVTEPTGFGAGQSEFSIGSLRPDNAAEGWVGLIDNAWVLYGACGVLALIFVVKALTAHRERGLALFTLERETAQSRHRSLFDFDGISYCGAYWGNGFHEDGVNSALEVTSVLNNQFDQPEEPCTAVFTKAGSGIVV